MNKSALLSMIMAVTLLTASIAQDKRYGIERAVVKRNTVMGMGLMQQTIPSIQYIDDFGLKESVETFMNMQGQMFTVFTMVKDGYIYSANLTFGQGTKINLAAMEDFQNVNYLNLTDEVRKKHQIEEKANEQFLGKDCKRYDLTVNVQGQSAKVSVWVWQGLPLKTVTIVTGATIVEEATEIQEGAEIDKEKFELPEGVNFMEVTP